MTMKMTNTKAYYTLTSKRNELEDKIEIKNEEIKAIREEAKKLKKGSPERQELMEKAELMAQDPELQKMKIEVATLNYSINIVFYN